MKRWIHAGSGCCGAHLGAGPRTHRLHDPLAPPRSAERPHASSSTTDGGPAPSPASAPTPWSHALRGRHKVGHLAPGSDPSVLPGDILVADKPNNRLLRSIPYGRVV